MKRYAVLVGMVLLCASMFFAGQETCGECHEDLILSTATLIHTRVAGLTCKTCHSAAMKHVETGDTGGLIPEDPQNLCFGCHTDLLCDGEHCGRDTYTCNSCHCVHHGSGPAMLSGENRKCQSCHKDSAAQMHLPNHHPVPEGKMTCVSCHSPHSSFKPSEATGKDINDLCWKCHSNYQGPFIFEHAPVVEDCRICHEPHGSIADSLLTQNEPFLCLQCHEFHFHTGLEAAEGDVMNVGGTDFSNPNGISGFKHAYATKCTQCHSQVHGTDLPSQTVTGHGTGLIR